ncbi:hypothetical protein HPB52_005626 [Rhipicephalus sanguineus]|uniref:Uncharacterized protein n=1 Tax=Rhipicephalus sanguineus TaxID=34632 RepID=A0A9D4T1J6_RHISA|nr:hypothetical protein HPB52_005626 [Rhipicephalus sanguineus]
MVARNLLYNALHFFHTCAVFGPRDEAADSGRRPVGEVRLVCAIKSPRKRQVTGYVENVRKAPGVKPRRQVKRCAARDDELLPAFLRLALDQDVPARSSSGGLSQIQGRGLLNGSCQDAVASGRFVDEAYPVFSSWVVPGPEPREIRPVVAGLAATCYSTASPTAAHPCANDRSSRINRATSALAHVDQRTMPGG